MSESVEYYEALLGSDYVTWSSACWTVVVSSSPARELWPLLGGNVEVLSPISFPSLVELSSAEDRFETWRSGLAWVVQLETGVALLEPNGFGASVPNTFVKLAARGDVSAGLYWNDAIARNEISLGREGVVDTASLVYWDPDEAHPLLSRHLDEYDIETGYAGGLVIVEAATGIRLTKAILDGEYPVAVFDVS